MQYRLFATKARLKTFANKYKTTNNIKLYKISFELIKLTNFLRININKKIKNTKPKIWNENNTPQLKPLQIGPAKFILIF